MENKELLTKTHFLPIAAETVRLVGYTVVKLGKFVVKPFEGGWADLGRVRDAEPTPAKVTIYEGEDPLEKEADY